MEKKINLTNTEFNFIKESLYETIRKRQASGEIIDSLKQKFELGNNCKEE